MTGTQVLTKFHNMIDDQLDSDFELQLLNDAKDEIESMKDWEMLKASTTYSIASGYSYTSSAGSLPTRFIMDSLVTEGNGLDYTKIRFEDLNARQHNVRGYWLDMANSALYISGSNHAAKTVYLFYTAGSADITTTTSWAFPSRFHKALALKMAEMYYLSDATEKGRAYNQEWAQQFAGEMRFMEIWDDRLKLKNRRPSGRGVITGRNVYP